MSLIALLVGSRTADAPARALAQHVGEVLEQLGHITFLVDAGAIDATALVDGDTADPSVENLVAVVDAADALVVISPVIKAGSSGTTRLLLELLPDGALAGVPVLSLNAGTSETGLDESAGRELRSAVRALSGLPLPCAVQISVFDITRHGCATTLADTAQALVHEALTGLARALDRSTADAAGPPGELIDADTALRRIRDGALLLDVRSDPAAGTGLLPGAVHVRKVDVATIFRHSAGQPALIAGPERDIVVVCNSERGSAEATRQLRALGYQRVAHVRGGAADLAAAADTDRAAQR
ncbi:NAD(P)H-dependent oxidoreductase [Nocardia sp. alder85J]|uniref:NAD(P)H-dependent oxidoreductase n=1 Tax=Nocardia sp. alder85J TaxID=2862949 RepID=UPI001CD7E442|nr:NAD(P)H-dependent oxidoreductase [Nocardia sp. alder85J]MCX4098177.1 NAD(P)H-dependent oxidoreductase [Nocardia sp. alder85J]